MRRRRPPSSDPLEYARRVAEDISHVRKLLLERWRAKVSRRESLARLRVLLKYAHGQIDADTCIEHARKHWDDRSADEITDEAADGWPLAPFDPEDGWPEHWLDSQPPDLPEGCTAVTGLTGTPDDLNGPYLQALPAQGVGVVEVGGVPVADMEGALQFLRQKEYETEYARHLSMRSCVEWVEEQGRVIWMLRMFIKTAREKCTCEAVAGQLGVSMDRMVFLVEHELSYELEDGDIRDPDVIDAIEE
jgi:hypothetical protein